LPRLDADRRLRAAMRERCTAPNRGGEVSRARPKYCRSRGERLFIVTRTVLATKARLVGATDLSATGRPEQATLETDCVDHTMVIGFRTLEIVDADGAVALKGVSEPFRFRDARYR
jgi:hypothetical protein